MVFTNEHVHFFCLSVLFIRTRGQRLIPWDQQKFLIKGRRFSMQLHIVNEHGLGPKTNNKVNDELGIDSNSIWEVYTYGGRVSTGIDAVK